MAGACPGHFVLRGREDNIKPWVAIDIFMSTLHFEGMTEHRTTVRIPADLLLRAKTKAAEEDRTLTSLIEEGLRIVVAEPRRSVTNKRILPRISKSSGGPLPGIDISKSARLQEMDDLEYVARMKRAK